MKYIKLYEEHNGEIADFAEEFPIIIGDYKLTWEFLSKHFNNVIDVSINNENAINHFKKYLSNLDHYIKNGGILYRVIFEEDEKKINKSEIGNHWTYDYENLLHNISTFKDGEYVGLNEYMIKGEISKNSINVEESIEVFCENPYEFEFFIDNSIITILNIKKL